MTEKEEGKPAANKGFQPISRKHCGNGNSHWVGKAEEATPVGLQTWCGKPQAS